MNELFSNVEDKTKEKYVQPSLILCVTCTTSFDLCMLQVGYDIFPWLLISWIVHGNPPIWLWGYLKCIIQQM